jgi:outer membrane immunogenic protein
LDGSLQGIPYNLKGVIGGGQAGFNYQIGNIVLGVEGDMSAADIKGSVTDTVNAYTVTTKLDWLATVRGRVGLAFDRILVYGTAGVAIAHAKSTLDDSFSGPLVITTTSSADYVGWTGGGGIEWALSPNWSIKGEYLYADLGSKVYNFYEVAPGDHITGKAKITTSVARGGFNFRF